MQTLDIVRPEMPDLQFALLVTALCTSQLPSFNVPEPVRATIFDRCWALVNDGPPPIKPQERVLDLRPWTEVTLEAMLVIIRGVLTDAGIRTLTWEHPPREPTCTNPAAAHPVIERLLQHYPRLPQVGDPAHGDAVVSGNDTLRAGAPRRPVKGERAMDSQDKHVRELVGELRALIPMFTAALERRAAEIDARGGDSELAGKLVKGADVMRDSGNLYVTWARHYAALSEGHPDAADETDAAEFSV